MNKKTFLVWGWIFILVSVLSFILMSFQIVLILIIFLPSFIFMFLTGIFWVRFGLGKRKIIEHSVSSVKHGIVGLVFFIVGFFGVILFGEPIPKGVMLSRYSPISIVSIICFAIFFIALFLAWQTKK
ncbi:MAG: hypothetical protein ABIE94_04385 [archaeon]